MSVYGEIAAVLTALCWSFNSVVFTRAGLRVGAATVNAFRLWIALPALALLHWLLFGTPLPFAIEMGRFLCLGISGIVGFVLSNNPRWHACCHDRACMAERSSGVASQQ